MITTIQAMRTKLLADATVERYESDEPPVEGAGICHCRECQRWTGSAYCRAVGFHLSGFRYTNIKGSKPNIAYLSLET